MDNSFRFWDLLWYPSIDTHSRRRSNVFEDARFDFAQI